ncbi:uncharacterized protein LOC127284127 [Leptopilina boulardi]|uniref:uncharacterized protein LOC127283451 n=1 Tax=Leptopilina boulardi TaxID=63433 RepID=UPI0021F5E1FE|nr:uncharacterized protein LOC127283451 [Leptopilina boulardi]XP_051165383.1 uncharacterized protein LOC127284127 [Leptopilina boulardi]
MNFKVPMDKKIRTREPNLLSSEREALLTIIQDHRHIIDCRKTDGVSLDRKKEEWRKICDRFNVISGIHHREASFLKQSWENIKKRVKKDAAERKLQTFKTGGGPFNKPKEDPESDRVLGLLQATASGFNNTYDGDSSFLTSPFKSNAEILDPSAFEDDEMQESNADGEKDEETETVKDWSRYTPQMLRQPISQALKVDSTNDKQYHEYVPSEETTQSTTLSTPEAGKKMSFISERMSRRRPVLPKKVVDPSTNEAKIKTLESTLRIAEEQHELNMLHIKEEHSLKMQILQEHLCQEKLKTRILNAEMYEKCDKSDIEWLDPNME